MTTRATARTLRARHRYRAEASAVVVISLTSHGSPVVPNVSGQSVLNAAPPVDGGWPRSITTAIGANLVIDQPQIASWVDLKELVYSYNPRTGAYGHTTQGANTYGSWGSTSVQRGDRWATTRRTTNNATGVTKRTTQSSAGSSARVTGPGGNSSAVAKSDSGDLYASHDGNVYKKSDSGSWQEYDNGSWSSVQRPTQTPATTDASRTSVSPATIGQVQSDSAARAAGTQRTNTYSRLRSSGAAGASSDHPKSGEGHRRTNESRKAK